MERAHTQKMKQTLKLFLVLVTLPLLISVPPKPQSLSHSVSDGDGTIDILFPVCYPPGNCSQENSIHVIYNQQERICQSIFDRNCRYDGDLCSHRDFVFSKFDSPPSAV